ncbi:MAG: AsmA family protein [Proteobacteria bacterium]|nr:AsmA family protein [Pseudomonadota bacterium]MBI3496733.1 AsmA family protein [Pseudomonadota bacterium]
MRSRRVALALGILTLLAVGGAVAIVSSIDPAAYATFAAERVREATGRQLTIAGPIGVQLWPRPAMRAEGISFANPAGGSRLAMLTLKRLELEVALWPLLKGEIIIERIVLVEPDLLLETDASGHRNWQLSGTGGSADVANAEPKAAGGLPGLPRVRKLALEAGRITYQDERAGERYSLALQALNLEQDAEDGLKLDLAARLAEMPVTLAGILGAPEAIVSGAAFPVDLKGSVGSAAVQVFGTVEPALRSARLQLSLAAPSLAELGRPAALSLADVAPVEFSAELAGDASRIALSGVKLRLGAIRLDAEGTFDPTLATGDLTLGAAAETLDDFGRLLTVRLPPVGPIEATARVRLDGRSVTMDAIKARLGDSDLAGKVVITVDAPRPKILASLSATRIDLAPLLAASEPPAGQRPARRGPVFDTAPVDLSPLLRADVDAEMAAGEILALGTALHEAKAVISLANGTFKLERFAGKLVDGEVSLQGVLAAEDSAARVSGAGEFRKLDLGRLLSELKLTDMLVGKADGHFRLNAKGGSAHELAQSLDGLVILDVGEGVIRSHRLELIAGDLVTRLAPWARNDGDARMNCALLRADIARGLAESKVLLLDTQRMTVAGEGKVDLGRETIDLKLTPHPKQAAIVSLAVPILVRGTLSDPTAFPDPLGLARGVAGVVVGTAINPLGALVPFLSAGSGEQPCQKARPAMADGAPRISEQPAARPAQAPTPRAAQPAKPGGIQGLFEGLGSILKR